MSELTPKKDSTKSIHWLSIKKDIQEKLVGLYSDYYDEEFVFPEAMKLQELKLSVHHALGLQGELTLSLINQLESITTNVEGGIIDDVKKYIEKYNTVCDAVQETYKQRNGFVDKGMPI